MGWRAAYGVFGGLCVAIAGAFAFFVKEPERGQLLTEEQREQQAEDAAIKAQEEEERIAKGLKKPSAFR